VTLTRTQARDLLARHDLSPSKALGQHFVVDPNTVRRIARLADIGPGDHVVEIGAGLGALTLALADTGASVTTVEIDRHVVPALQEVLADAASPVRLVEGDALELDWSDVLAPADQWVLVANLPYNVATPLIADLLDDVPAIERFLVMVQREAGERLVASPGTKAYGIPSVKVAYWATAELVGRVAPSVFLPEPNVESVLVRIDRRPEPAGDVEPGPLFALVRTAFGQRRKMLRRSLAAEVRPEQFAAAGIRPDARPEELAVDDWCRLAAAVTASS
jgi:16S rRNA (adenine1518-N6/adenine1519-N6)-dimethyltransferase